MKFLPVFSPLMQSLTIRRSKSKKAILLSLKTIPYSLQVLIDNHNIALTLRRKMILQLAQLSPLKIKKELLKQQNPYILLETAVLLM